MYMARTACDSCFNIVTLNPTLYLLAVSNSKFLFSVEDMTFHIKLPYFSLNHLHPSPKISERYTCPKF